jgi:hypothetical protein
MAFVLATRLKKKVDEDMFYVQVVGLVDSMVLQK